MQVFLPQVDRWTYQSIREKRETKNLANTHFQMKQNYFPSDNFSLLSTWAQCFYFILDPDGKIGLLNPKIILSKSCFLMCRQKLVCLNFFQIIIMWNKYSWIATSFCLHLTQVFSQGSSSLLELIWDRPIQKQRTAQKPNVSDSFISLTKSSFILNSSSNTTHQELISYMFYRVPNKVTRNHHTFQLPLQSKLWQSACHEIHIIGPPNFQRVSEVK